MTDFDQGRIFAVTHILNRGEAILKRCKDEGVEIGVRVILGMAEAYMEKIKNENHNN